MLFYWNGQNWRVHLAVLPNTFFSPDPDKTFHRGSTDYFVSDRKIDIGAFDSPKFIGLPVGEILGIGKNDISVQTTEPLANGDGLNVLYKREVVGFRANTVQQVCEYEQDGQMIRQYRVVPNDMRAELKQLRPPYQLNRNMDHNWPASNCKRNLLSVAFSGLAGAVG